MKSLNTFALGMAVGNIALGLMNNDANRVSLFFVMLVGLLITRRWCE